MRLLRRFWEWLNQAQRRREAFFRDMDALDARIAKLDRDLRRLQQKRVGEWWER